MTIAFTHFATICNNYCMAYHGLVPEYIVQLRALRPIFKVAFPKLNLFISCRDEFMYLMGDEEGVIPLSQYRDSKHRFSYCREIGTSIEPPHAIFRLVDESIPNCKIAIEPRQPVSNRCLICPEGALPTKVFEDVTRLKAYAEQAGYRVKVAGSNLHPSKAQVDFRPGDGEKLSLVQKADWVIGVENEFLFEAVRLGIKTTLVPTGLGTSLYKFLCPAGEIFPV